MSSCFFFQRPARTTRPIFTLYGSTAQMTWFSPRTVLFGLERWVTLFGGMCPKNPPKGDVNRHFQAKLPKSKNCNISETIYPISPKFDDETHTVNDTSWVVHHCHIWNTTWLTSAILKFDILPIVQITQNSVCRHKMRCRWRLIGQSRNRK